MVTECEYTIVGAKFQLLSKQQRVVLEKNLKSIHHEQKQWLRQHEVQINNFKKMHKCVLPKIESQKKLEMRSNKPSDEETKSNISSNKINDVWRSQEFKTLKFHHHTHRLCLGRRLKSNLSTDFNFLQTHKKSENLPPLSARSRLDGEASPQIRRKPEPVVLPTSSSSSHCGLTSIRRSSVCMSPISSIPFQNKFVTDLHGVLNGNTKKDSKSPVHIPLKSPGDRDKDSSTIGYTPHKKNNEVMANFETELHVCLAGNTSSRNSSKDKNISDERSSTSDNAFRSHIGLPITYSSAENNCGLSKAEESKEEYHSITKPSGVDPKHSSEMIVKCAESRDVLKLPTINNTQNDKTSNASIELTKMHTHKKSKDELKEHEEEVETNEGMERAEVKVTTANLSKWNVFRPLNRAQLVLIKKACDTTEASKKKNSLFELCMQLCTKARNIFFNSTLKNDVSLKREIYYRQSTKSSNNKEKRKRSKISRSEIKSYEIKTLKTLVKFSKGPKRAELMARLVSINNLTDFPKLKESWQDVLLECNYLRNESDKNNYD